MDALTTKQAADRLGVTPGRIRQLVLDGRLPAQKLGRDLFIRPEDLDRLERRRPGRPRKEQTMQYFTTIADVVQELRRLDDELTVQYSDEELYDIIRGTYTGRYEDIEDADLNAILVALYVHDGCDPEDARWIVEH